MAARKTAWGFLGGYFLFFIGWVAGLVGAVVAQGGPTGPYGDNAAPVSLTATAAAVLLFALGVQVLVRAYWGGMSAHPELMVIFVLTPIPAIAAVAINLVGRYFRQSDGTVLRVLLLGGGVYLAATTAMDLVNNGLPTGQDTPAAFLWPFALSAGVGMALLGFLPPARTAPEPEPEPVAA
ncbi:MAG TPA: hypothetical protein VH092_36085 [Urbifossiella sp.]|jgi:hypothetical protein|nr:hypothetical protein [Urbifossiella sp.]